jgi:hypothetical protein
MNSEIENVTKKKTKFRFSYVLGDEPYLDWLIILVVGTLIAISGIVSGLMSYTNLDNVMKRLPDLASKQASQFSNIYDKNKLELLLKLIDDRSKNGYRSNDRKITDPSI